ncbi:unnamed protein product [Ixodes pacificus]
MCDGVDPYTLRVGMNTTSDADLLSATTHVDIINYLVLSTSYISLLQMKAYKSLEAHNYFTSGWVKSLTAMRLPSKRIVVLSEVIFNLSLYSYVNHSQRLGEAPLKAWLLADADGSVITAHYTCMAGAGEACSHIGATLFTVETAVRLRNSRTCTEKENVWLPAHSPGTQYKWLRDIDFSSSKRKKRQMDGINQRLNAEVVPPSHPVVPHAPTEEELRIFHSRLSGAGAVPALFMVHPQYSGRFEPPCRREPSLLRNLLCAEARSEDLPALVSRTDKVLAELVVSEEMVTNVEKSTRAQSKCAKWYSYRAGRITASVMKSVCSTSVTQPSISLLKKICYPEQNTFTSAATAWGLEHEDDAVASYVDVMVKNHTNYTHRKTGVYLSTQHPYIAASPDSLVCCACCGKGVVEVKCPHSLAINTIQNAVNDSDFCLDDVVSSLRLKRKHPFSIRYRHR